MTQPPLYETHENPTSSFKQQVDKSLETDIHQCTIHFMLEAKQSIEILAELFQWREKKSLLCKVIGHMKWNKYYVPRETENTISFNLVQSSIT
jgi:hypothetical protein